MNKIEKYTALLNAAKSLINNNVDDIANMANLCRLISDYSPNHWIGFYRVVDKKLELGPFQGPIACTSISYGKGVCGTAWKTKETQVIDDVNLFPGHIACSSLSQSEIVVPCIRNGKVFAVLDIDSVELSAFNGVDKKYLEELVSQL